MIFFRDLTLSLGLHHGQFFLIKMDWLPCFFVEKKVSGFAKIYFKGPSSLSPPPPIEFWGGDCELDPKMVLLVAEIAENLK